MTKEVATGLLKQVNLKVCLYIMSCQSISLVVVRWTHFIHSIITIYNTTFEIRTIFLAPIFYEIAVEIF